MGRGGFSIGHSEAAPVAGRAGDVLREWDDLGITQETHDGYFQYHRESMQNAFADIDSLVATGKRAWRARTRALPGPFDLRLQDAPLRGAHASQSCINYLKKLQYTFI